MKRSITVVKKILEENENAAAENRARADAAGVTVINLISAPGSGKTTLLEKTIPLLAGDGHPSAVIVGDLQTTRDAERLEGTGAAIVQVNTEGGCHLSAPQVAAAMARIDLAELSFLFIENVGNMVCPSAFDLGEHRRVAMLSTPEGDDKVAKYDRLFLTADLVLLNKVDLAGVLGYDRTRVCEDMARINEKTRIIEISAADGTGLDAWTAWLLSP